MGLSKTALRGAIEASVNSVGMGTPHSAEHCCDDGPLVTHPLLTSKPFWPPYCRVWALTVASLAVLHWVLRCFDRLRSGRKSAGTSRALADVNEKACLGDYSTDTDKEGGESKDDGSSGPFHEAPHTLPSERPAAQGMETVPANEASTHLLQEWSEENRDALWQWYPEAAGAASAAELSPQWTQSPLELQLDPLNVGDTYFPTGDLQQSMHKQPGLAANRLFQRVVDQVPYMYKAPDTDTSYPHFQEPSDQETVFLPFKYPEGPWYQTPHNPMDSAQLQFNQAGLLTHRDGDSMASGGQHAGGSDHGPRPPKGGTLEEWEGRGLPPAARQQAINVLDWMHRNAFMCSSVLPFLSTGQGARLALITLKILTMDLGVLWLVPADLEPVRQSIGDALLELVESTTSYKGKGKKENNNIKEVSSLAPLIRQIMLPRQEDKPVDPKRRQARTFTMMGWVRMINLYLARMLWDIPVFAESASREDLAKVVEQDIKVLNALWDLHKKYVKLDKMHRRHVLDSQKNSGNKMLLSSKEVNAAKTNTFPPFEKITNEFEQTVSNAGGVPRPAASVPETSGDGANIATYSVVEWPYHPLNIANPQLGVPTAPQQSRMPFTTAQYRLPSSTGPISQALSPEGWIADQPPQGW